MAKRYRGWMAIGCLVLLNGCKTSRRHPTVTLDNWWNVDYAKNACELYKRNFGVFCDGNVIAAEIRNEFVTSFRANPACTNVVLYTGFTSPEQVKEKAPDVEWTLMLEPSITEGEINWEQSQWSVLYHDERASYGQGNLKDMKKATTLVCDNVNGVGGQVK